MNVYDLVESKVCQLAALISTVLGFVQVTCSCVLLESILRSESLAYYSYGLQVGELRLTEGPRGYTEAFDLLTSRIGPVLLTLKITASLGLVGGLVQMGGSFVLWMVTEKFTKIFNLWFSTAIISGLLFLIGIILPSVYGLTHSTEIKSFLVVTTLNILLKVHLLTVILIKTKGTEMEEDQGDQDGDNTVAIVPTETQVPVPNVNNVVPLPATTATRP